MVKEEKIRMVEEIKDFLKGHEAIVIVDMFKTPTNAFQKIKDKLKDFDFKYVKKSLLLISIDQLKDENLAKIKEHLPDQILLIGAGGDPFKIFMRIKSASVRRFAKPGDVAEEDVIIPAGPTPLPAGPAISEFAKVKIPAGVEGGKIAVKRTTKVAESGQEIPENIISLLRKLHIRPVKVVLNVVAVYKDGKVYTKEILELVEVYPEKLKECVANALNLCIAVGYPTKESVKYLLIKAYTHAKIIREKIGGVGG
ncbi:MAG: 50S ribosomal protein L10 [Candidatus Aenigmarchaeota archaeon]|nr:50S ribosomal protein L10 [Candidatus Aenigmarchaeota archaeon]